MENLSPELMPFQGSNLASALRLALTQLQADSGRGGDIVLIGDDVDDSELQQALALLQGHSVRVSVLTVGTPAGAPVRLPNGSLLTNAQGQPIVAQSNLANMAKLAAQTGGIFSPCNTITATSNSLPRSAINLGCGSRWKAVNKRAVSLVLTVVLADAPDSRLKFAAVS